MIVADTHAWLWWLSDRTLLSPAAREALDGDAVAVSPMTFWECAILAERNRIVLDAPPLTWISQALARSRTVVAELSVEVAVLAATLRTDLVRDPADRIIVATALHHRVPLVTKDGKITASSLVPTIW